MPKLLFWNLKGENLGRQLARLCISHDPDIIVLAESEVNEIDLLNSINTAAHRRYSPVMNVGGRVKFYSVYGHERTEALIDSHYFAIRLVTPYLGPQLIVAGVHFPSKRHANEFDQLAAARNLSETLRAVERDNRGARTVVIGDFNMSPFEPGMVAASGMHAIADRTIAEQIGRRFQRTHYPFFYNPMWSTQGDFSHGPPGTFKYSRSSDVNYYWHTFDQVLLRPSLISSFDPENLEIIEQEGSDHFPIFINLTTEVVSNG